ncbi:MAG: formate/nitrite family of transporter [Herbinix sp.]|jgi:nitrite transporter NirC|nr:formate/nitrite family of transporter [Herbinix sp.]
MFFEEISAVMNSARIKTDFLKKNPVGYFLASILAGAFVGFGILLIFSIGGMLQGQPYVKIVMGLSFGIALSLVIIAGAELFTGNNFVMTVGALGKTVSWSETLKLWIVCFLGNWVGAIILALIFQGTGLTKGATGEFIAAASAVKMNLEILPLFFRAILCNMLVCLAIWSGFRCKSESGKLIMVFWCLFAFITSGYEHSVANMTLLTVSILSPLSADISIAGYFYNIIVVSLGNMVGAILGLAIPYFIIASKKEDKASTKKEI